MGSTSKRVTVDIGGTFTDCVVMDASGDLRQFKSPTTPSNPSDGLLNALGKAAVSYGESTDDFLKSVDVLVHGTTLATNTLLTLRGAKTGMLTTKGMRDILEIRRGIKPVDISLYNIFIPPNRPLIPRSRRLPVLERTLYNGEISEPLNEQDVIDAVNQLKEDDVESVAICFLHSYANPTNELRAAEIVKEVAPDMYVTTSFDTLPVWREFERFNTTAVGAFVGPVVTNYLNDLQQRLHDASFQGTLLMMLTNGMVQTVEQTIDKAVYLLHSGPAAAPSAAIYLGDLVDEKNLLSVDMGGTSFDVCLIRDREVPTTTESWVGDQRVGIKMVDLETVGAGGGSIASIDGLGLLKVGPESAVADPGPACFGRGTEPTVTDADLVLGYMPADFFLGGEIQLDTELAKKAIEKVAEPLDMDVVEAAQAIFDSVNAAMAGQITEVSTKQGYDVRDTAMVAGGGAGAVHAGFIAESLGIPKVVIPSTSGVYSAFGMFAMDPGQDYARTFVTRLDDTDPVAMTEMYESMESEAVEAFATMGVDEDKIVFQRTAEMRHIGQFHEVETAVPGGKLTTEALKVAEQAFREKHEQLYAFSMPWKGVEQLTLRLKATTPRVPFQLQATEAGSEDASGAFKRSRSCYFSGQKVETSVYDGVKLSSGNVVPGPAIIEEATTTVVIPEQYTCSVDRYKNYILTRNQESV